VRLTLLTIHDESYRLRELTNDYTRRDMDINLSNISMGIQVVAYHSLEVQAAATKQLRSNRKAEPKRPRSSRITPLPEPRASVKAATPYISKSTAAHSSGCR